MGQDTHANDNPLPLIPPVCRVNPFGPQPLSPLLRPQWPARPMEDQIACAFTQACDVWRYYLDDYLSTEPGEVIIPKDPRGIATYFVILTLEHCLPREPTVEIADGLAIAAFYEVLRERTAGQLEAFSVSRSPRTPPWREVTAWLAPTLERTNPDAYATLHARARAMWYERLPRGLPDAEYDVYRFNQLRELVFDDAMAALPTDLPSDVASHAAWTATNSAF